MALNIGVASPGPVDGVVGELSGPVMFRVTDEHGNAVASAPVHVSVDPTLGTLQNGRASISLTTGAAGTEEYGCVIAQVRAKRSGPIEVHGDAGGRVAVQHVAAQMPAPVPHDNTIEIPYFTPPPTARRTSIGPIGWPGASIAMCVLAALLLGILGLAWLSKPTSASSGNNDADTVARMLAEQARRDAEQAKEGLNQHRRDQSERDGGQDDAIGMTGQVARVYTDERLRSLFQRVTDRHRQMQNGGGGDICTQLPHLRLPGCSYP
ncbi:MAG: Ig-like domain-containing protein [bacterium]|nr:Ig-like domain-containing protein [bacterium]